ncbi:hypothetical protein [Pseudonocardia spirodelae]|uniref:Collagen-like protein n=1 Tax=Pseudonocardia spirodelae TaxID=3133431 RepID=A0ABU8TC64_9PSEU
MSTDTSPAPVTAGGPARPRLSRGRRVAAGTAVAVALLGAAACGTSGASAGQATGTGTSGQSTGTAAAPAGSDALMACLEQNGVPAPPDGGPGGQAGQAGQGGQGGQDGQAGSAGGSGGQGTPPTGAPAAGAAGGDGAPQAPPGVDSDVWAAAQQACASVAQESGTGG